MKVAIRVSSTFLADALWEVLSDDPRFSPCHEAETDDVVMLVDHPRALGGRRGVVVDVRLALTQLLDRLALLADEPIREIAPATSLALTSREREVLLAFASAESARAVARQLGIAVGTLDKHRSNVLKKLQVSTLAQALARAQALGLLQKRQAR